MSYFRPAIDNMTGYISGEQPKPGTAVIKLNTNENPYPPSPKVIEALRNLDVECLRRYPDPFAREFCQAASAALGVPADWIIAGNGSDELLNVLIRACANGNERRVVYPMPTYVLYQTLAEIQPATTVEIPYPADWRLPIADLVAARGAVTFVASPNSPSGHIVPIADLRVLASQITGVLVIDEAYVDFAPDSALQLVREFENVIVLRTLSKGYSLAGLRMGFGIANPALLSGLFKVKDSYNIDAIAMLLGTAAMQDQGYKNSCVDRVKKSRAQLAIDLQKIGYTVGESHGNFLLATPPSGTASLIYQGLKDRGILVRYFASPGLDDKLRITIGTNEQNLLLIETLTTL
jgi:histidinol-phosphate aminotransferase